METTGWMKGLKFTADGTGVVSHAGVTLVRGAPAHQSSRPKPAGMQSGATNEAPADSSDG